MLNQHRGTYRDSQEGESGFHCRTNRTYACNEGGKGAWEMDAKLFSQEHDSVPGLKHIGAHVPAHIARTALDLREGTTGRFSRVTEAGLKGSRLRLQVHAQNPNRIHIFSL
jgi:hypothetical protein